jgi:RNA polymerase sigma-70 factor (ECF subfamily)
MAKPERPTPRPNAQGFGEWYADAYPRLVVALALIGHDRDFARDAAAEACARALERWDRVRTMSSPDGWAYRVGVNVLHRRYRRVAIERRILARVRPEASIDSTELDPALWDAVRALPDRQREAVALRYVLDLEQHEVAEAMGIRPGTVASTLHAARAQLASVLVIVDPDDDELTEVE